MGAWGESVFDNDAAGDFLDAIEEQGFAVIRARLRQFDSEDADECSEALAAAAVVAAARGQTIPDLPSDLTQQLPSLGRSCTDQDVAHAIAAVERIGTDSELQQLWDEAGEEQAERWHSNVRQILAALQRLS